MWYSQNVGASAYNSEVILSGVWLTSLEIWLSKRVTVCPEKYHQSTIVFEFLLQASSNERLMGIGILDVDNS